VRCYAEGGIAAASRLSVCLSVTLRYRGHIGWKSSKLFTRLISLGCSLPTESNITDLLQGEHPKILAGIWVGYGKRGFQHTKAQNLSERWQDSTKVTIYYWGPTGSPTRAFDWSKINDLGCPWRVITHCFKTSIQTCSIQSSPRKFEWR